MTTLALAMAAVTAVSLICGCSTRTGSTATLHTTSNEFRSTTTENGDHHSTQANGWLEPARIQSAVTRELQIFGNGQALLEHRREMQQLQEESDILLEQEGLDKLRMVRSRLGATFPAISFMPSEIARILSMAKRPPIGTVVVLVPYEGSDPDLIRATDKALREAGVQRRIFQIFGPIRYIQLDSAAANN